MPRCPSCSAPFRDEPVTCSVCGRALAIPARPDAPAAVSLPAPPPWSWREHRPRRHRSRPGSALLGWVVFATGLVLVPNGAGMMLAGIAGLDAPIAASAPVLGVGFVLVALGWRMGRERRPVGPMAWLSRRLNVPGLVDSMRSSRPAGRPLSAARDPVRASAEARHAALGVAAGLAWLAAASFAVGFEVRWLPQWSWIVVLAVGAAAATVGGAVGGALVARDRARRGRAHHPAHPAR